MDAGLEGLHLISVQIVIFLKIQVSVKIALRRKPPAMTQIFQIGKYEKVSLVCTFS